MSFLAPTALAAGLLALPILALYMLKLRRREVEISSTLLWQRLLRDREANAPWQRLKRNLLLLVQLLLLALLVLALARPFQRVPTVAEGAAILLLDASASMQAADVQPSRFEAARTAARRLLDGLAPDSQAAVILVGRQPEVIAPMTRDRQALRRAVAEARPGSGAADWEAAFALAAGLARAAGAGAATTVVLSDGGLPGDLPPLPGEVRYLPLGASADNLALEALAVRAAAGGPQLFARLANYGDDDRPVIVSFFRDDILFNAQQVSAPAGSSLPLTLAGLPDGPAVYRAALSRPADEGGAEGLDALDLDDAAWAVYQPPAGGRALVVSPPNIFLEQALAAQPGLQSFRLAPEAALPPDPFDLYVYDGVISGTLPAGNLLLVNPASNPLFNVGGVFTDTAVVRVLSDDPLLKAVDWRQVHVLRARRVTPPDWARVVVEAEGGPLLLAGENDGRQVVVLSFDLHESDLPLQVAFPILMSNVVNILAPGQGLDLPEGLHPGDPVSLGAAAGGMRVQAPDGSLASPSQAAGGWVFAGTQAPGVYAVLSGDAVAGRFAVNLFDAGESNIRPAQVIRVGRSDVASAAGQSVGVRELWRWLALAGIVLLLGEWWLYHRGPSLPSLRARLPGRGPAAEPR